MTANRSFSSKRPSRGSWCDRCQHHSQPCITYLCVSQATASIARKAPTKSAAFERTVCIDSPGSVLRVRSRTGGGSGGRGAHAGRARAPAARAAPIRRPTERCATAAATCSSSRARARSQPSTATIVLFAGVLADVLPAAASLIVTSIEVVLDLEGQPELRGEAARGFNLPGGRAATRAPVSTAATKRAPVFWWCTCCTEAVSPWRDCCRSRSWPATRPSKPIALESVATSSIRASHSSASARAITANAWFRRATDARIAVSSPYATCVAGRPRRIAHCPSTAGRRG
jgi:hypothetical protein